MTSELITFRYLKGVGGALSYESLAWLAGIGALQEFVETGTYLGDTLETARSVFPTVRSIELSHELHARARRRFAGQGGVHLYQGDSGRVLPQLLAEVGPAALVWLDAHFSEGETARSDDGNTPIVSELEAIRASGRNDLWILVDDIRLFQPAGQADRAAPSLAGYPGLDVVLGAVLAIDAGYEAFLVGDSLLAVPPGANAKASDVVRACTLSRFYGIGPLGPEQVIEAEAAIAAANGDEAEALLQLPERFAVSEPIGLCGHYRLWQGLILEARGDLAGAIDSFERARRQGLADWRADWYLARATLSAGDLQAAADAAARAQELMPRQADAQVRPTGDLETLRAVGLWTPGEPLRLHLGCGERRIDGYVNVDFPPTEHNLMHVAADVFADIAELDFPGASVDEIRCHHVFEHFGRVATLALLIRWHGWLKVGGRLWIETPDLEGSAKVILSDRPWREKTAAVRHLAGDQAAGWGYHLDLWFPERLERTLTAMGFEMESSGSWSWSHPPHLANVEVRYRKARHLDADALLATAEGILEESLVSRTEKPLLGTWKTQLRAALDGRLPGPGRQAPASAGGMPPLPDWADTRTPLAELHDANQRTRDTWVRAKAREIPAGSRVLDVGAGTCPYRDAFAHCEYRTHDFKRYEGVKLGGTADYGDIDYVSDIVAIPVPDASFDVVLCTEVLEHVPEPAAALREMARVLRPGGRLLLTAPLGSGLHQQPFHYYGGFTPHWYEHFAGECGLEIQEVTPNGGMFALLAQECARVTWTLARHRHLHGAGLAHVEALFGEWLPRLLNGLDRQCPIDQFTIGYHVDAVKTTPVWSGLASEPSETLVGVVFSKDRPLQLDATIRSFLRHARDADRCSLHVLYRASDAQMAELYGRLAAEHPETRFVEEKDFREDLLRIVRDSRHVLFVVDDNLFVRPFSLAESTEQLDADATTIGISLRLGQNTEYCYTLSRPQALPDFMPSGSGLLRFRWPGAEADFGYPLELSSSLYRTADVLALLEGLHFANPNTLEAGLAALAPRFAAGAPHLCCYPQSAAFCVPVNMVQDVCQNRAGNRGDLSAKHLAKLFADGHRIDVTYYDGFLPNACHQEIDLRTQATLAVGVAVSVVIPCFRQAEFLEEAVESVVAQSFENWECIIVDDGSPDDTAATAERLIAAHPDRRIRLVRQRNQGLAAARNAAIRGAQGRYVLPLDADDALHPNYLARAVAVLEEEPTASIVYVDEQNFGESHHVHQKGESSLQLLKYGNVHDYCSLYRYEVWDAVGGYSPAMYLGGEDWNFWVAAAKLGYRSVHVPEALFRYRSRAGTMVATTLANLAEVHAQLVLHHPDIYSEAERLGAEARLSHLSAPNQERLIKAVAMSPGNSMLERFLGLATGRSPTTRGEAPTLEDNPLVSVVVTTKNRPELLGDALRSVVGQTYTHWEVLVVNDGGADVSEIVAAADPQRRIRYLHHPKSRGLSCARNTGINFSIGDILCYLDDDDLLLPWHLDTVVRELRSSNAEFLYTEAEYVAEALESGGRIVQGRSRPFAGITYSKSRLHVSNFIPVNTWAHRRELLERTGVFDTTLRALEDWDLLLRVCQATEPVHLDEVTVEVRQRPKAQGDHMCQRERTEFPALYRTLYQRYPVDFDPSLEQQRQRVLADLDRAGAPGTEADTPEAPSYERWLERRALKESDAQYMAERMMTEWRLRPTFHVLVPHCRGEEEALADTLDSLSAQLYRDWGVSVVSEQPAPAGWVALPNVEWLQVGAPPMEAVNAVAERSGADWFVLLEAGIQLAPDALFACVDWLNLNRDWRLMYADEDRIDVNGKRHSPAFKPGCNRDLLRSLPFMGDVLAVRADLLRAVGGYDIREGVAAYGLALRALELAGENGIGHVPKVLVHSQDRFQRRRDDAAVAENRRSALVDHLTRCGEAADVFTGLVKDTHFVDYRLLGDDRVSIVIPQRRERGTLGVCVERLLSRTQYPNFEVTVVADAAHADLPEDSRLRIVSTGERLTYAEAVGRGVAVATGEFVLLLHDDCLVVQENWLTRLVANGQREGVGVVGARLVDADQRVSHAGLVLGLTGTVGRMGAGATLSDPGYGSRLHVAQTVSAVSGACLLIRRSLFQQIGGMDAEGFPELFTDADLCMRAANSGLQIVWTPFVTFVGSALPRAVDVEAARREKDELHARWLPRLADDPAFNPNLSLTDKAVSVETELDVSWDRPFRPRPRIWAFPLDDQGVGQYRVRAPMAALDRAMLAQVDFLPMHELARVVRVPNLPELVRAAPDTLLIQHGYIDLFLDWIPRYRRYTDTFVVFGQDDNMFEVPEKNANRGKLAHDIERRVAEVMRLCDRLVVTTEPLAEAYRRFAADIRIVPNHLEGWRWRDLRSLRRQGRRPRVGWAGAQQHLGDLDWLEPVVRALADEIEWVFMGMCPDMLRPYVAEFHAPVPFSRYPDKLASLHLDLAIAPLEIHPFNECKSDLRILEYGALGWPVVATDIHPYRGKPVTLLPNDPARWIAAIRERVHDLDALADEGENLKAWVLRYRLIDDHAGDWFQALVDDASLRRLSVTPGMAA